MAPDDLPGQMRSAATALLNAMDGPQRLLAAQPFTDDAARRWLEYRPRQRPGACVADFTVAARKAASRLLATALSEHAYAQAMAIIALEEVLDRQEGWRRGRHSGDYWVSVFGDPAGGEPWSWRFEGHHLSVTMTLLGDQISPAPVFLGANPARVSYAGRPVSRPLGPEEDLARELLDALGPAGRAEAVVADRAPADIRTSTSPRAGAEGEIEPLGLAAAEAGAHGARAARPGLVALYTGRLLASALAYSGEAARIGAGELYFAWEDWSPPCTRHYYRIQGADLLIEYDNTTREPRAHRAAPPAQRLRRRRASPRHYCQARH